MGQSARAVTARLGIAERRASRRQGAEAKVRGATLTFAERAFAGAELRAHRRLTIADCRVKSAMSLRTLGRKRGGCGGWTTRSHAKPVNAGSARPLKPKLNRNSDR